MVLIDKIALMDRIAKECHYDTEHPDSMEGADDEYVGK